MRAVGSLLALVGLVVLVVGLFMGCGSLFSWNGRHAADVVPVVPGTPKVHELRPVPGRRYTVSVQVVFARESVPLREGGSAEVSAKMPVVARVVDARGATLAEATGWLDPEEPPTVLYGSHPSPRRAGGTELAAERLVGSFPATSADPIEVRVDLGQDRVGKARIEEARLVLYDDVTPPSIKMKFGVAGAGGLALVVGLGLVIGSFFRGGSRRGGIRGR